MQMPVRVVYQVGMDFVGEDQYVVLHAQFADARQFFPGEDAPGRIVRIRHQQRFRSGQLAVQIVEVDDEPSVRRLYQRIFENAPSVETGLPRERMIHRRLDYDSVSFRCECPERENDPRYDPRREVEPLAAQLPTSVPFDPADDGVPIGVRPVGIAQNGMFRPLAYRFRDLGRCGEVHIGDPERNDVVPAENLVPQVEFFARSAFPAYFLVKIVFHMQSNRLQIYGKL